MSSKSQISTLRQNGGRAFKFQIGTAALVIVAAVYLLTFQNDICSNPSEYVIDSGEYQIALSLWGTVHHTGAPTYSMLGATFVSLLRLVGISPAAGAALFSVVCTLVGLGFIYALGVHLTDNPWASGAAVLALALSKSFWINSVITEQRGFGIALEVASLWLAVCYAHSRSERTLYALAFVWGQAVVHHRLAVLMAPALAVLVLPGFLSDLKRAPRLLAGCMGMSLLAFAFYIYMPLRAWMGAWTYGDPGTWQGFWFIFWAREVPFLMHPPSNVAGLIENIRDTLRQLVVEWTAPGLIAVGLGLAVSAAWSKTRRAGWAMIALVVSFVAYLFIWHVAVSPEKVLLWVGVGLALALTILAAYLWQAPRWAGVAGVAALIVLAAISGVTHRQEVLSLTRDPHGREVINLLKAEMPPGRNGVEPTFMALWGGDYFAAAYGSRVTGELRGFRVVDHRANFRQIVESSSRLITLPSTFNELPKSWWRERIGGAYLSSAGLGLVEIGAKPPLTTADVPAGTPTEVGDGISLLSYQIKPTGGTLRVTLYWQAAQTPSQNYSVFVHLSDKDQISGPDDIIAQSDSQNPVYGWYPTTKWGAGEIVREDYGLDVLRGKTPRLLSVGMYTRNASGAFHDLGVVNLPLGAK
jgi:hypothetical protein